ncbi:MAG: hypothetical protein R2733_24160 [Acidimicrobiales bacterium]
MSDDPSRTAGDDARFLALLVDAALFDDATLEHLSNKGLVRRAHKLLETPPQLESADALDVIAVEWRVRFEWSTPLSKATCDCATAGICQHVIAAIIALREAHADLHPAPTPTDRPVVSSTPTAGDILSGLLGRHDEELAKWATSAELRWAHQRLASIDPTQIIVIEDGSVTVELPPPHAIVRFMATTFDSAIVKPTTPNDRRSVTLAVLALWLSHGREVVRDDATPARRTELPKERQALVQRADRVCRDLVAIGLLHLGDAERERLDSLAASFRGAKLYRLALLAERAADQVDALAALSVDADTSRLLDHLAEISAVAEAIDTQIAAGQLLPEGLCGTARARYEPVGQLRIMGLGHYDWGDHRFAGTTGIFATPSARFFAVARPRVVSGRHLPEALGWTGVGDVSALSGKHVTLSGAKASSSHRLSASPTTTAATVGPVTNDDLARLAWGGTRPTVPSRLLGRSEPGWTVVAVEGQVSPPRFDTISQQFQWELTAAGAGIVVTMPYRPSSVGALANLERIASEGPPEYLVGRLRADGQTLSLWPISAMTNGTLRNLAAPRIAGGVLPDETAASANAPIATIDHLDRLSARLVRVADGGRRPTTSTDLTSLASTARDWGYTILHQVIAAAPDPSVSVLRAAWTLLLLRDADGSDAPDSAE